MIDEAVAFLGMRSEGLQITVLAPRDLPAVLIDKNQNPAGADKLMRNAVEATGTGTPRALQLSAVSTDAQHVQVSVKDTGPGLVKEVADRHFQPFV